nr:uncharacterized protein LOC113809476 isoform X1 [Penaeus vannamei]
MTDPDQTLARWWYASFDILDRLLVCVEDGVRIPQDQHLQIVKILRTMLRRFRCLLRRDAAKGWLTNQTELIQSLAVHFLKNVILSSRRSEFLAGVEANVSEDAALLDELLGHSNTAVLMSVLRGSSVLWERKEVRRSQLGAFCIIAEFIMTVYLARATPDEDCQWRGLMLARMWLVNCPQDRRKEVKLKVMRVLPHVVPWKRSGKQCGKKRFLTSKLLEVKLIKLVKMAPPYPEAAEAGLDKLFDSQTGERSIRIFLSRLEADILLLRRCLSQVSRATGTSVARNRLASASLVSRKMQEPTTTQTTQLTLARTSTGGRLNQFVRNFLRYKQKEK